MSWPTYPIDGATIILQSRGQVITADYLAGEAEGRTGVYVAPVPGSGIVCTNCDPAYEIPHTDDDQDIVVRRDALFAHVRYHRDVATIGRPWVSIEQALAEVSA